MAATNSTVDQAHAAAAFVIWHSLYVRELELALQSIDSTVFIPYWDWTIDGESTTPTNSIIFTEDYFGSSENAKNSYIVTNGRLAKWPISTSPLDYINWSSPEGYLRSKNNYNTGPYITRYVGNGGKARLPYSSEFNACITGPKIYGDFWPCIWGTGNKQTIIHAGVHQFGGGQWTPSSISLGLHLRDNIHNYNNNNTAPTVEATGDMMDPITSPNDPLFFSHHANLDRLYYNWKIQIGDSLATVDDPCGTFYGGNTTNPQPAGHNLNDVFTPPFYTFDGVTQLTLSSACYNMHTSRIQWKYE